MSQALSSAGRRAGPRDRAKLIDAIGRGRVTRVNGVDWWHRANGNITGRVMVNRAMLNGLVDDGVAHLDAGNVWQLTHQPKENP